MTNVEQLLDAARKVLWHIGTDEQCQALPEKYRWTTTRDEAAQLLASALAAFPSNAKGEQ